jgi:hypothetical protein
MFSSSPQCVNHSRHNLTVVTKYTCPVTECEVYSYKVRLFHPPQSHPNLSFNLSTEVTTSNIIQTWMTSVHHTYIYNKYKCTQCAWSVFTAASQWPHSSPEWQDMESFIHAVTQDTIRFSLWPFYACWLQDWFCWLAQGSATFWVGRVKNYNLQNFKVFKEPQHFFLPTYK